MSTPTSEKCHCRVCVGDHAGHGPCTLPSNPNDELLASELETLVRWHENHAPGCVAVDILKSAQRQLRSRSNAHETRPVDMYLLKMVRRQLHIGHTSYAIEALNYVIEGKQPPPCVPCEVAELHAQKASE